ncbi:MAG: pilus assembly protein [Noviherbaspirillum sp.]
MKPHLHRKTLVVALATALLATGCTSLSPNLDSQFGYSVYSFRAEQTLNPDASKDTRLTQMDGQAAHSAVERYQKSFSAPEPQPNVFTIGLGRR